jgi:hypothetical protein
MHVFIDRLTLNDLRDVAQYFAARENKSGEP